MKFTIADLRLPRVWAALLLLATLNLQLSTAWAYPPAPATQTQVNAGREPYLYVTPATLVNWSTNGSFAGGTNGGNSYTTNIYNVGATNIITTNNLFLDVAYTNNTGSNLLVIAAWNIPPQGGVSAWVDYGCTGSWTTNGGVDTLPGVYDQHHMLAVACRPGDAIMFHDDNPDAPWGSTNQPGSVQQWIYSGIGAVTGSGGGGGGDITAASLSSGTNSFAGNGVGLTNLFSSLNQSTRQSSIAIYTNFTVVSGLTGYAGNYILVYSNTYNYGGPITNWMIWRNQSDSTKFLSLNDPTLNANLSPHFPLWSLGPSNDVGLASEFYTTQTIPSASWLDTVTLSPVYGAFAYFNKPLTTVTNAGDFSFSPPNTDSGVRFVSSATGDDLKSGKSTFDSLSTAGRGLMLSTNIVLEAGYYGEYMLLTSNQVVSGAGISQTKIQNPGGASPFTLQNETTVQDMTVIGQLSANIAAGHQAWLRNIESSPDISEIDAYSSGNMYGTINWLNCYLHTTYDTFAFMSGERGSTHNIYGSRLLTEGIAAGGLGNYVTGIQAAGTNVTFNVVGSTITITNGLPANGYNPLFMFNSGSSNVNINLAGVVLDSSRAAAEILITNQSAAQNLVRGNAVLNGTNIMFSDVVILNGAKLSGDASGATNIPASAITSPLGGTPTFTTNITQSVMITNVAFVGAPKDGAMVLRWTTTGATQAASSNYITVNLSSAVSTNAVIPVFSGVDTNASVAAGVSIRYQIVNRTSNSFTIATGNTAPAATSGWTIAIQVARP